MVCFSHLLKNFPEFVVIHTIKGFNVVNEAERNESEFAQSCLTLCDPMDCGLPGLKSVKFSRQEYWSVYSFPSTGDLPNLWIKSRYPTLQVDYLPSEPPGSS